MHPRRWHSSRAAPRPAAQLPGDVVSAESAAQLDAFRGVTEITLLAPNHPRLLAMVAGACTGAGANIVDAQIFTTTDGLALDTIVVSREFSEDDVEKGDGAERQDEAAPHQAKR